ncbi:enoyl-CoA hydratase/isomerase family protein [Clostridiaceae bacterium]|nr:enoyl-CoA hydratase/isomerase family protein [Clostridiaceae bacterium]RKI10766.1 enoyl-CoA hydratase/isomerase family protein [bacterium 1XD21-70]
MEFQNFLLEIDEQGIALFTANRPDRMNALNDACWAEMEHFFAWADTAPEVKAVIVTGAGEKAFIAGADLNVLKLKKPIDCLGGAGQKALGRIQKCAKPVIAAVNGYAFGGGCETAIACDFRVVCEKAVFALPETGLGLLPGAGGTQRLSRLIGLGRAQDMILLGRKVGGAEAVQIGLASRCVSREELVAEAKRMAGKLAAKGPVAVRLAKRVVQASYFGSQETGELLELLALSTLCGTEDKEEGIAAFLEKRAPEFRGR